MTPKSTQLRFAIMAADTAFFLFRDGQLFVRLIRVHRPPHFTDHWGLPGGLLDPRETADQAAVRHLAEKGGVAKGYFEQLYTFSALDRDPRGRVVAVAYIGLGHEKAIGETPSDSDEHGSGWYPIRKLPRLAYDHRQIIAKAVERIRSKLEYSNIARTLLAPAFTLAELQNLYEAVLVRKLDKRNFRKKILGLGLLVSTGRRRAVGASRPAELYRFKDKHVRISKVL